MKYSRFLVMVAASTLAMFGLMYLNTYEAAHASFSQTRLWMALVMGAAMTILMLAFMHQMYRSSAINLVILLAASAVFVASLWLVRSQATVDDVAYMKAMVPHHSVAILTSKRAHISDPRVRILADRIIATQEREISEMQGLISELEQSRGADQTQR